MRRSALVVAILALPPIGCATGTHSYLFVSAFPAAGDGSCQQSCARAFGKASTRGCSHAPEPRELVCIYDTPHEPPLRPRRAGCAAACAQATRLRVVSCQAVRTPTGQEAFACRYRAPFY